MGFIGQLYLYTSHSCMGYIAIPIYSCMGYIEQLYLHTSHSCMGYIEQLYTSAACQTSISLPPPPPLLPSDHPASEYGDIRRQSKPGRQGTGEPQFPLATGCGTHGDHGRIKRSSPHTQQSSARPIHLQVGHYSFQGLGGRET